MNLVTLKHSRQIHKVMAQVVKCGVTVSTEEINAQIDCYKVNGFTIREVKAKRVTVDYLGHRWSFTTCEENKLTFRKGEMIMSSWCVMDESFN